jgi:SAM-dependent methyltransferase
MSGHVCRFCGASLSQVFCDLGSSPPSNAYRRPEQRDTPELFFPLRVFVCTDCYLVQLPQYQRADEIFSDYAYFSSFTDSWLAHAAQYTAQIIDRYQITPAHTVVEVASNDGYLLRNFAARGIPVLGVEPAANVAAAAIADGIPTLIRFFGADTARAMVLDGTRADLLIGNNVLAHVPDLNGFVAGLQLLLAEDGVLTMEFPHLLQLMRGNQFDTIYHEHFSYFSLLTVVRLFAHHGLTVVDVEELPTHGGSLRVYARQATFGEAAAESVARLLATERTAGLDRPDSYVQFSEGVERAKRALLRFLIAARDEGKQVVGYGAPAKGNTLLNYCGVRTDLLAYTVDRSPHKQGTLLPGTHIPVRAPEALRDTRPDYVLLLPWNLRDELTEKLQYVRAWGGQLVVPIPTVEILP